MPVITATEAGSANRCAFLDMIAWSEIGPALLAASDDGYNVMVGSTPQHPLLFTDYTRHPGVLNAQLNSTAAGRYQLLYRYWLAYQRSLGLPDFSPLSQDKIALQQIRERGALAHIDGGFFALAVGACSSIWASLPGNSYKQHTNDLQSLQRAYQGAGGTLAIN